LPGGKVGGVGDVIRDLPRALAARGDAVTVVIPAYGMFNRLPGATKQAELNVDFGGSVHQAEVWALPVTETGVSQLVIEHPLLSPDGPGKIYCNDGPDRPFATDAGKFAFFSATVATLVQQMPELPDVVHLHDWHAALYLVLREADPVFSQLRTLRTVFTIHNLAYQGIRPLANDASAFKTWFPGLQVSADMIGDPRYADCVNPMATAIRLADKLNTVSATYAREIIQPNDPARGFDGGEGLDQILREAADAGRLTGILNGCEYPARRGRRPGWDRLRVVAAEAVDDWGATAPSALQVASGERIAQLPRRRPAIVLTSVARLTPQKCALFLQPMTDSRTPLAAILETLGRRGVLILLGSGDSALEQQMQQMQVEHKNFLFLCGYSDALSSMLYQAGDFFLMPSSFEPCGISQMLAMRSGQPCVAHAVGGLRDTIDPPHTGLLFSGDTPTAQADAFFASVRQACQLKVDAPDDWRAMSKAAAAQRFSWDVAAERYRTELYEPD